MKELEFPDDEIGTKLRELVRKGVNLNKVRNVEFAILIAGAEDAEGLVEELRRLGHQSEIRGPVDADLQSGDAAWEIIVTHRIKTNHFNLSAIEGALAEIASPFGGHNDGWGFLE